MEAALREATRSFRESQIEEEVGALVSELFGPEQTQQIEEPMSVEAWQPTMPRGSSGTVRSPWRVTGPDAIRTGFAG
jgi:hypothetical protein